MTTGKKTFLSAMAAMGALAGHGLAEDPAIAQSRQAMSDGVPQVAIHKLNEALPRFSEPADQAAAQILLGQALFEAGKAAEAETALEKAGAARGDEGDFWLAQSLAAQGKQDAALALYQSLADRPSQVRSGESRIGQARMLMALGRRDEAIAILKKLASENGPLHNLACLDLAGLLLNSGKPAEAEAALDLKEPSNLEATQERFLRATAALDLKDSKRAADLFSTILHADATTSAEACIGVASARQLMGTPADASNVLEQFIRDNPNHPELARLFAKLDEIYAVENTTTSRLLRRWAENDDGTPRHPLAAYYLARNEERLKNLDRSAQFYGAFLQMSPQSPLADSARAALAAQKISAGLPDDAIACLNGAGQSARCYFLRGQALAMKHDYTGAVAAYQQAASLDASKSAQALFNAAVCEMVAGVSSDKNVSLARMRSEMPGSPALKDFELVEALRFAAQRDPSAGARLKAIIADASDPARIGRARLALAELEYLANDPAAARQDLQKVSTQDAVSQQKAESLAIFLADNGQPDGESKALALANDFLTKHPGSLLEPEVRMKLGEILFRRGDFAGAHVQLESLARNFPDSPLAEKALFLSAQALSRSMDPSAVQQAILLYEEVANGGGDLALRARFEQGLLQAGLKKPKEAMAIFDKILASKPDAELRLATMMEEGNTLYNAGPGDPANFRGAIAIWKQIVDDTATPMPWRNQALARMGMAYEKLGDRDSALACDYDVISAPQSSVPDFFWFYEAGFNAVRLLESQKLWNEAIKVYQKISAVDGPRADEARERMNRLRLENFIWE